MNILIASMIFIMHALATAGLLTGGTGALVLGVSKAVYFCNYFLSNKCSRSENNNAAGNIVKTASYVIGHQRISQTVDVGGQKTQHFFTFDGHGSTMVLTDFAGATAQLYSFDAYGNALGFDPALAKTEFLYSGEQFDSKIGQQYLRARYYDPTTGRFNRLDPFFGNLSDPQSFHKYLYTHADPINMIDPSGNMGIGMACSISIGIGLTTTAIAKFGFGFSWTHSASIGASAGIGTMMFLLPFTRLLATSSSMSTPLFLLMKTTAFSSSLTGLGLTTGSLFTIGLNIPSLFFNPDRAKAMNDQWLDDFANRFPNPNNSNVLKAKIALSKILDYASNKQSVYSVLTTLDSVFGSGTPSSPCGDWSEAVWNKVAAIIHSDPETLEAFRSLNIDICVNEWKSTVAEAHYTVGIKIGNEKWEIDNGYAWLSIPWDSYLVGVPFMQSTYDSNGTKFVKVDPQCTSIHY